MALVSLRGSTRTQYTVLDLQDINQPTTVSTFANDYPPVFAGSTEVSWVRGPTLLKKPFDGSPTVVVEPAHGLYNNSFAWNSEGTAVAYVTNVDESQSQVRIVKDGQDRVIGSMPPLVPTHACVYQSCADHADIRLLFSPTGTSISFVQNYGGPSLRVWSSDGAVLDSIDAESSTMSVWSGDTLYFRDDGGVERWRVGTQSVMLSGVFWIRPKGSPAGGQIVFEALELGAPDVFLLDISTGNVRLLPHLRSEPAFLTSRYIWYQGERPCASGDGPPCNSGGLTIASGKTYIYDLQTGAEAESNITNVLDVWPHPA